MNGNTIIYEAYKASKSLIEQRAVGVNN